MCFEKNDGRNCVQCFTGEMHLSRYLHQAIQKK